MHMLSIQRRAKTRQRLALQRLGHALALQGLDLPLEAVRFEIALRSLDLRLEPSPATRFVLSAKSPFPFV